MTVSSARRAPRPAESARRRLGRVVSAVEERRAEILSLAYGLGALGVLCAWAVDPAGVTNAYTVGIIIGLAAVGSVVAFALRHRLPPHAEDVAITASLVLIPLGAVNLADPTLIQPYYVWVGFASPLWFPTRRSVVYLVLTALASGAGAAAVGTRAALATWFVTTATVLLAFLAVHTLTRMMVRHERLAAVGEMASAIGHELRNPLGAVANALYLARMALGEPLDPDVDRNLQVAERETARAVAMSEDLRAFVRPRRPVPTPVDLAALVDEVLESTPAPPAVAVELDLHPVALVADRGHVGEILTNLVENAYQAMPEGGTLQVASAHDHERVVLSVTDTGNGMDESLASRIFEPFFTTRAQGTGLGLAIVERLAEENGGTVAVKSAPGHGTRFTVRLPAGGPGRTADRARAPEQPH